MLFTKQYIDVSKTFLFSNLFQDYLNQDSKVKSFYENHFSQNDFEKYLQTNDFNYVNRSILVEVLKEQTTLVNNTTELSINNIELLKKQTTYTVTTGHQLCLFTGPLYFIYKIISTITLCNTLKEKFPNKDFVPVYWMASEDHDFEEINHIHVFGKKITWESSQKGSVGEFNTEGLNNVFNELKLILGANKNADDLINLFDQAYNKHLNLADATRYLVNELFGNYGLVILDGNNSKLKSLFKEEFKKEILENTSVELVNETIDKLKLHYSAQVSPREINVFYKEKGLRERIEKKGEYFTVLNTEIKFSEQEMKNLIENNPENLSPNVVLRPLYQQKILPNIAYVGGPGEIAYWLEYKTMFNTFLIHFPILTPRNFVTLLDKNTQNKLQKLKLSVDDIFKDGEELVKQFIKTQHNNINLEDAKNKLNEIYASILETVTSIDKSLIGSTEAEKQKATNGISTIEQKINRALKQKSETDVNQIWAIKEKLFPNAIPQERYDNFSMYYTKYGKDFITELAINLTYNLGDFDYCILKEI